MKWWFIILVALSVLTVISTQLPNTYTITEEKSLEMDIECAYQQVSDFNQWLQWHFPNPENVDSIPNAIYFGEVYKQGHEMWVPYGDDTLTFLLSEAGNNHIEYEMKRMHDNEKLVGDISFTNEGNGYVRAKWSVTGTIGFRPLARFMNMFMQINKSVGEDIQKSLARLEKNC